MGQHDQHEVQEGADDPVYLRGERHKRSVRAFGLDHDGDGLEEDIQIQPKRPIIDIPDVPFDEAGKGKIAASADLPQPGDAGTDFKSLKLSEIFFFNLL